MDEMVLLISYFDLFDLIRFPFINSLGQTFDIP